MVEPIDYSTEISMVNLSEFNEVRATSKL